MICLINYEPYSYMNNLIFDPLKSLLKMYNNYFTVLIEEFYHASNNSTARRPDQIWKALGKINEYR